MKIKRPEILSPAGNAEMLTAAVRSGADAVYLGAEEFSARRNAENFNDEQLKSAIAYCRIRGVRVYLTLNIILRDSELPAALNLAERAYNYGIDGIITEDLGLAALLHRHLPDLPLHASTQMSVHTPAALPVLKKMGFVQVVAAREMSYSALKEFCATANKLDIAVEVFVHGALCMSVSGQCLFSAFLGSRSGNRGLCAGPCRLPFSVNGGTGYDLSLKDLSLLSHIKELCDIGVSSFKIEGRMKRPEYVAAATAACRQAVDNGFIDETLFKTLGDVFSRSGFTDGYFKNNLGRDMFGIRTAEDVNASAGAFSYLHTLYRCERQSVDITADIKINSDAPSELILSDGKNTVTAYGEIPQTAQNKALTDKSVKQSLNKFGSTPYLLKNINISLEENLFLSTGAINALRRDAAEKLNAARATPQRDEVHINYTLPETAVKRKKSPDFYIRVESAEQIPESLEGITGIIFPLEKEPPAINGDIKLIADIPRGISNDGYIIKRLEDFRKKGFTHALCGNLSAIESAKNSGFEIIGDTGLNIYNSVSAEAIGTIGAESVILSNEILLSDAAALNFPIPKGIIAYGNIPLMLMKSCPLKNGHRCDECDGKGVITDRRGTEFTVRCRGGYSELLNSVPVWLADKAEDLKAVDFAVLYFTDETPCRVKEVISAYKNGMPADIKYTRGLFYRGVL